MENITEEALTKEIAGEQNAQVSGIMADLESEFTEEEPKSEEPAQEETPAEEPAQEEPAKEEEPAEEQPAEEEPAEEPKSEEPAEPVMYAGKFKTVEDLVNGYKNLEKKMGEKAQEVKEVVQAKSDDFDLAVKQKIAEENWKLVDKAFETITNPDDAKEAQYLLSQFKKTGDGALLEKARGFLDARVDRRLEVDAMNMAAKIQQTANAHREEILLKPLSEEFDKMAEEDPEFMNDEQNQNLMAMAIKLNPSTVDVRSVKKAIQEYKESAYQKGYEAAKKEFAKQAEKKAVSVKSTTHIEQPKPKKSFASMSIAEQLDEEMKTLLS
ncbi:MAG: hypothetical protein J6U92_03070 [Clostridia bacterium]|nr:hypothetical protein [Clostridia bacterium]